MALLRFPFVPRLHPPLPHHRHHPLSTSAFFRPSLAITAAHIHRHIPARDRLIDFGKHKGRMLGTLPSAYLLWISRTLRAGDTEEWARLADEVLADPFYRDRLEWESAERVLTGGDMTVMTDSPVADLLEISRRFGWDNEDKAGWEKVDFKLLGTSRGGRIPRVSGRRGKIENEEEEEEEVVMVRGKRGERRERQKVRRREEMRKVRKEVVGDVRRESESNNGHQQGFVNPFPGRSALLDKIKGREADFD